MTPRTVEPLLLTVPEAAKLLNISRITVFKLLREGDLASLTIGRKRLIPRDAVERFIRERTGKRLAPTRPPEATP